VSYGKHKDSPPETVTLSLPVALLGRPSHSFIDDLFVSPNMVTQLIQLAQSVCTFVSPQLATDVGGAVPTFAFATTNNNYLALQGQVKSASM
jgi:hypothetical protein